MSNMFLNIVSTFKNDGISAATRQLGAFGKQAGGLGSTLGKVGTALASFGIAAKAVQFTSQSIDSARDLERNLFSLNTVFGDMSPMMEKFTRNAHEIGLSQKDAAKASVFLGSVLKQSGFSMADVTEQSQKLVTLGVDLAATYGYDVSEALLGMTALFRGEYDPIEKFGVAMKQSEINSELAARGLNNLEGAARRNAEQIIRMELLYERAADATGAFTGQSGNLFVEQKKLQAQFENMQASIGNQLLPVMGALVEQLVPLVDYLGPKIAQAVDDSLPALEGFVSFIKDMSDTTTSTGEAVQLLTGFIGGLASFIGSNFSVLVQLTLLIGGVTTAVNLLNVALAFTRANPIVATLTGLATVFILLTEANKNLKYAIDDTDASVTSFNTSLAQSAAASDYVISKYGEFPKPLAEISEKTREIAAEVANADQAKLNNLKDAIMGVKISAAEAANEVRRMRRYAGLPDIDSGATTVGSGSGTSGSGSGAGAAATVAATTATETGPTGLQAWLANAQEDAKKARKRIALIAAGLSEAVADSILSSSDPINAANEALNLIAEGGTQAIKTLTSAFRRSDEGQELAAKKAEERARKEKERLERQKAALESFNDAVKQLYSQIKDSIMSAFTLPNLGNSISSITRNMQKLLARTRTFATNIAQLGQMGLNSTLLQQVIAAGPVAGSQLAAALVSGGSSFIGEINSSFGEFGNLASSIAGVGTQAAFANPQTVNNYSVSVTGGLATGADVGAAVVNAIRNYERQSGSGWRA
jgi:hypothetical protein